MRLFILMLAIVASFLSATFGQLASGQEPTSHTNWRVERTALDRQYADRIEEIAQWCRGHNIQQQVEETFKLYRPRDLQRQYIFVPADEGMPVPPAGILGQWLTKINELKAWQAERIFELAQRAVESDATAAFQFLNEVLYLNRDHAQVRNILGHNKTDEGWRVASDRIKVRTASRPNESLKWPARSYLEVTTPHFEIESNASEERTRYLAERLERWHGIWRQVFFEYWSSSKTLKKWIDGKSSYRHSKRRFKVVFFQQRDDYVAALSNSVRGVEVSTGFYSSDQQISFFYDSAEEEVEPTWRHELTHQLFRESTRSGKNAFEDQFIWLDEGIATYFESLVDYGGWVTLGGFDTRRIQYSRIRLLLENFHVPLSELSQIGRTDLQARPDMVRLYSESAGLADMLMNAENGETEQPLIEFLKLIYAGRKIRDGSFEKMIGYTYDELDARYRQHLIVDSARVERHLAAPLTRTEMSLSRANLQDDAYEAVGSCHGLKWLDLSGNTITAQRLTHLVGCQELSQIFLTDCPVQRGALEVLSQFENLQELDLSGSSIDDQQLLELKGLNRLTSLRLVSTRVTDAGLSAIANLSGLRSLDVTRTKVSPAGIARLKQSLPNLEVVQ